MAGLALHPDSLLTALQMGAISVRRSSPASRRSLTLSSSTGILHDRTIRSSHSQHSRSRRRRAMERREAHCPPSRSSISLVGPRGVHEAITTRTIRYNLSERTRKQRYAPPPSILARLFANSSSCTFSSSSCVIPLLPDFLATFFCFSPCFVERWGGNGQERKKVSAEPKARAARNAP